VYLALLLQYLLILSPHDFILCFKDCQQELYIFFKDLITCVISGT